MKSHFIISTDCHTIETLRRKITRIHKRIDSEKCKGHGIYNRKSFCGIDSFLSSCKIGNKKSVSIEHVSITLRFLLKKKKKERKRQILHCSFPMTTQLARTSRLFPSWLPSLSSCGLLVDLRRPTHHKCVTQRFSILSSSCQCSDR